MSGNTFTLTVQEGANIDVTVSKVADVTYTDLVHLYIQSIRFSTSLSATAGRRYRVAIVQPASFPTGYTGVTTVGLKTELLLSAGSFVSQGASDPYDGVYSFTTAVTTSKIGVQQVQPQDAPIPAKFILETSLDSGASWLAVPFTGTGTNYSFDIGDGTSRTYDTKATENNYDSNNGAVPNTILQANKATLYYNTGYAYTPALNSTISTVTIAGTVYIAYLDPVPLGTPLVTPGNDFTLYVPNSTNTDGVAGVLAVEDKQTIIVPTAELNLMDLGLSTAGLQGPSAGTGAPVSKTVERGDDLTFHAVIPWSQVTVAAIEKTLGVRTDVNDIITPTYYGAFTYEGTTYTLSIVNGLSGSKNVRMIADTSYGATVTSDIYRIWIRPGVAGGGTATP